MSSPVTTSRTVGIRGRSVWSGGPRSGSSRSPGCRIHAYWTSWGGPEPFRFHPARRRRNSRVACAQWGGRFGLHSRNSGVLQDRRVARTRVETDIHSFPGAALHAISGCGHSPGRTPEHPAPATGARIRSGIAHRAPRRGGLDDPRSPGNTGLGSARKRGSGRSRRPPGRRVSRARAAVGGTIHRTVKIPGHP